MWAFYLNFEKNTEKNTEKFTEKIQKNFSIFFPVNCSVFFSVFFSVFLDGRSFCPSLPMLLSKSQVCCFTNSYFHFCIYIEIFLWWRFYATFESHRSPELDRIMPEITFNLLFTGNFTNSLDDSQRPRLLFYQ